MMRATGAGVAAVSRAGRARGLVGNAGAARAAPRAAVARHLDAPGAQNVGGHAASHVGQALVRALSSLAAGAGEGRVVVDLPAVRVTDYGASEAAPLPDAAHLGDGLAVLDDDPRDVLITCEHACKALPEGLEWGPVDEELDEHWKYDPGALDCGHALAQAKGAVITESRISRLVIDPNRPLASNSLIRTHADGMPIGLNAQGVDMDTRITEYYVPYHTVLGHTLRHTNASLIVSVHSYNRVYEGEERDFEVGVLMPENHKDAAYMVADAFLAAGISARVNAPWSAASGFMYAADSLRVSVSDPAAQPLAIMLEYRNDVAVDPAWRNTATDVMGAMCDRLIELRSTLVR